MQSTLCESLKLYRSVVSEELVSELLELHSERPTRSRIFTPSIVIWLMLFQRLSPDSSLNAAVDHLRSEASDFPLFGFERTTISRERISDSNSGFCKAKKRLDEDVLNGIVDRLNTRIGESLSKKTSNGIDPSVYLLDGSTFRISHTEENIE